MAKDEIKHTIVVTLSHAATVVVQTGDHVTKEMIIENMINDIQAGHGGLREWLWDSIVMTEELEKESV